MIDFLPADRAGGSSRSDVPSTLTALDGRGSPDLNESSRLEREPRLSEAIRPHTLTIPDGRRGGYANTRIRRLSAFGKCALYSVLMYYTEPWFKSQKGLFGRVLGGWTVACEHKRAPLDGCPFFYLKSRQKAGRTLIARPTKTAETEGLVAGFSLLLHFQTAVADTFDPDAS